VTYSLYNKSITCMADLDRNDIEHVLWAAGVLKDTPRPELLKNQVVASCFFEASTRTRLSFEAAVHRLGGAIVGFADGNQTSMANKGESLADSIKVIGSYAHALILRHPAAGAARLASEHTDIPVLNAGDGANEHPTQALTDLFTIHEHRGSLDELRLAVCGDLRYSRTVHSLARSLCFFRKVRLTCLAPPALSLPADLRAELENAGMSVHEANSLEDVLTDAEVLYMTRIQRERFTHKDAAPPTAPFQLTPAALHTAGPRMQVLHPLPRQEEIGPEIDTDPRAWYFQQAANGLWVRQALLALAITRDPQLHGGPGH